MRSFILKAVAVSALAVTIWGCKKSEKAIDEFDVTYTTDFPVNLTGAQRWTWIEKVVPVPTSIGDKLTNEGVTSDNVGTIKQKSFNISVKSPAGKKITDFKWLENYEFWMNVPNVDKVQCCNKSEYGKYLAAGNDWTKVNSTWVTGTNYRSHVIENQYDHKFRYFLNDSIISSPNVVLTITQVFTVKAIK